VKSPGVTEHPTPHDALFKAVFSEGESAFALLKASLAPELAAAIDPASLEQQPASFVDEELREVHRDLLFTAKLAGKDALLYVLFEHQSTVDPLMPLRLLRYIVRIWEAWLRDNPRARTIPAVLPLVLHQGPRPWSAATRLSDAIALPPDLLAAARKHMPELVVALRDLGASPAPSDPSPLVRLTLGLLRAAAADQDVVAELERLAPLVRELLSDPRGRVRFALLVRYTTLVVGEIDVTTVARRVRNAIGPEAGDVVMNIEQQIFSRVSSRVSGGSSNGSFASASESSTTRRERASTPRPPRIWSRGPIASSTPRTSPRSSSRRSRPRELAGAGPRPRLNLLVPRRRVARTRRSSDRRHTSWPYSRSVRLAARRREDSRSSPPSRLNRGSTRSCGIVPAGTSTARGTGRK
jgi:hypothetical protein